jgi:hypothetical protein
MVHLFLIQCDEAFLFLFLSLLNSNTLGMDTNNNEIKQKYEELALIIQAIIICGRKS